MDAQVQLGESVDGVVVLAIYELPHTLGVSRRWLKAYSSRPDALWDAERLHILAPAMTAALKALPSGSEIPALAGYIRDPKETLRAFTFAPLTQQQ